MYYAVGLNTNDEYAMAASKSQLLKQLELIFPSFKQYPQSDGSFRKRAIKNVLPEPVRIIKLNFAEDQK